MKSILWLAVTVKISVVNAFVAVPNGFLPLYVLQNPGIKRNFALCGRKKSAPPDVWVDLNSEEIPNPEHSLVLACTFSETYGPENERVGLDGERIYYRNGEFTSAGWKSNLGPPLPLAYEEESLLLAGWNDHDTLVDSGGFLWRAEHVLRETGMERKQIGEPAYKIGKFGGNITLQVPLPWCGPMELTARERLEESGKRLWDDVDNGIVHDDERWMVYYSRLASFVTRFGHANVPQQWPEDPHLARWVVQQRNLYRLYAHNKYYTYKIEPDGKLGPKNNRLTPWRIQKLYDIGFSFKTQFTWNDRYKQIVFLRDRDGRVDAENIRDADENGAFPGLQTWVHAQRTEYRKKQGGYPSRIDDDKIYRLDSLGFEWNPKGSAWAKREKELQAYRRQHGHIRVTRRQDRSLAEFLIEQRTQYRVYQETPWESTLTEENIQMLNDLGMEWNPLKTRWQRRFDTLKQFSTKNGHCRVPMGYKKDPSLALWVQKQRTLRKEGKLDPELETKLLTIGFVFDVSEDNFDRGMRKLIAYKEKYGDCLVPRSYEDKSLVMFVTNQRNQYRRLRYNITSSMTPQRQSQLEEIGFVFRVESSFDHHYEQLCEFYRIHGHSNVPVNHTDRVLASFVLQQRHVYRLLKAGKAKTMTPDRIAKLERIGFAWNVNEARWMERLGELKTYREKFGDCLVPDRYENRKLASWVRNQRRQYKLLKAGEKSNMTERRAKILEEAGMQWSDPNRYSRVKKK